MLALNCARYEIDYWKFHWWDEIDTRNVGVLCCPQNISGDRSDTN